MPAGPPDPRELGHYLTIAQVGLEMVVPIGLGLAMGRLSHLDVALVPGFGYGRITAAERAAFDKAVAENLLLEQEKLPDHVSKQALDALTKAARADRDNVNEIGERTDIISGASH